MIRIERFKSLETDPWFGRVFKKLKAEDRALCERWIVANDALDAGAFEQGVHRMFMDREKPRRWKEITELLHCCR